MPRRPLATVAAALLLAGCSALQGAAPTPTPGDFGTLSLALVKRDIEVANAVSADAGCDDVTLAPTAIGFDASGLDQEEPVRLRIYLFKNVEAYERRRADVDACAAAWATDPATFEFVDASPFVLAGQGPWGAGFKAAVRAAMFEAAGLGG